MEVAARMRWLVTGASGFLGERIASVLVARGHPVVAHGRRVTPRVPGAENALADLADPGEAVRLVESSRVGALVHAAALTDVALCQREPALASRDILDSTRNLAHAWRSLQPSSPAIALSTDLVFDGASAPYAEGSPPKPISVYGCLKLQAEESFLALDGGIVLRAALVFGLPGTRGRGFVSWMRGELLAGRPLVLFRDEFRTPVWTDDLADAVERLVLTGAPRGCYHAGGGERLSRAEMGVALARALGVDESLVRPAALAESTYAAPRPRDVSLDSSRLRHTLRWTPVGFMDFLSGHSEQLRTESSP